MWQELNSVSEDNKSSKGQWHGGKGSIQKDHDHDKYAQAWEKIFGKKDKNNHKSNNPKDV